MTGLLSMLIHTLTREYSILRDIYILIEDTTWLTKLVLENDDNYQISSLTGQRHQYNEFIKAREQRLRQTGNAKEYPWLDTIFHNLAFVRGGGYLCY